MPKQFELIDDGAIRNNGFLYTNTGVAIPKGTLKLIDDTYCFPIVDVAAVGEPGSTQLMVFEGRVRTTLKPTGEDWTAPKRLYWDVGTPELSIDSNVGADPYIASVYKDAPTGTTVAEILFHGRTERAEA
jgi:predicted RecA/RadA family phage recombinase